MKVLALVLLVVLCWAPSGCGGGGNGSTGSPGVNNTASLSGNWQLTSNSTVALGATGNISASLATSGTTVTGIAHISSPCYAYITDVPLYGLCGDEKNGRQHLQLAYDYASNDLEKQDVMDRISELEIGPK
jgi:hypothetical protein